MIPLSEAQILEQLLQLDSDARRRVLKAASASLTDAGQRSDDWLHALRSLRADLYARYGTLPVTLTSVRNELREERL